MSASTADSSAPTTRRARLFVTRLEPWSVMKAAFTLALSLAIVIIVASILIWLLLAVSGTFDILSTTVNDIGGSSSGLDVGGFLSFGRLVGFALVIAALEIALTTAFITVMAVIYNATVTFTGGVEVTLAEEPPVA